MATIDHVRHHHTRHGAPDSTQPGGGPTYGGTEMHVDHARQSRARKEVKTERDRLLKKANQMIDGRDDSKAADRRLHAKILLTTAALILGSGVPYAVILCSWIFGYQYSAIQTVGCFVLFVVIAGCLVIGSHPRATGKDRPWLWWLGILCLLSAVVALILGFFLYFGSLAYYFKYNELRTYTNVAAAQDAAAFSDGAMFLWTEDTNLDTMRSVGFKSKWTGKTYCVAPIVDSSMGVSDDIWYWAVGVDCCSSRAEFHCGDTSDLTTRSSLTVLEPEDVVRPWMKWAARGSDYESYMQAIHVEEASFYTKAALQPKLVYWTKDPAGLKNSFWKGPSQTAQIASYVYAVVLFICSYLIARRIFLQPVNKNYLFRANV
jgi:hypothetical protein